MTTFDDWWQNETSPPSCSRDDAQAIWQAARAMENEACAVELELSRASLLHLAGEMSADELRSVRAVLKNRAMTIRRHLVAVDTRAPAADGVST